jgi:D-ribose pyranase
MLRNGILNPHLLDLLARIRHTNTLVIADRGFPYWPEIETIDISLVDDIPRVLDVLAAIRANFLIGRIFMAQEFLASNSQETRAAFSVAMEGLEVNFEPHLDFKKRVPQAIGLIRTADTAPYANLILESA